MVITSETVKKYDGDTWVEESMDWGQVVNEKPHFILRILFI